MDAEARKCGKGWQGKKPPGCTRAKSSKKAKQPPRQGEISSSGSLGVAEIDSAYRAWKAPKSDGKLTSYQEKKLAEWEEKRKHLPAAAKISPQELEAINEYTGGQYLEINKALRGQVSDESRMSRSQAAAQLINSALSKLPSYGKQSYRGTHLLPEDLDKYEIGKTYQDPAFGSTSFDAKYVHGGNTYFIYYPKPKKSLAKDVTALSGFDQESEVLYPSGTRFKVLDKQVGVNHESNGKVYQNIIVLKEI
jgi:hypothetical protein